MNLEKISEIAIDDAGQLIVKPTKQLFEHIYRSALEVHWDSKKECLYSPKQGNGLILIGTNKL